MVEIKRNVEINERDKIKEIFENKNCELIGERTINGKGFSLYFVAVLNEIKLLYEISIAKNNSCRIVTKSKSKYFSFVACKSAIQWMK